MAHTSNLLVLASLLLSPLGCSGEVTVVPASDVDSGTGGTAGGTGIGGSDGGTEETGTGGAGGSAGGGAGAGGTGGFAGGPAPGQTILFEVSYENYAWGVQLNGIFITNDGSVFEYDYFGGDAGTTMPPALAQHATEDELRARWGVITGPTAVVPLNVLNEHFAQVESAAQGVLLYSFLCADAGQNSFIGYRYDSDSETYSRVIAGIDGDLAAKNLAPGADGIVAWLRELQGGGAFCEYRGFQCQGAVCAQPPPSCPNGQVPSVEGGCWGPCISPTSCLDVPDCSWCTNSICVQSQTGSLHCSPFLCSGPAPCDCPHSPCGGGADYCEAGEMLSCGDMG